MTAGNANMDRMNLTSRHQLRLFYRALDGVNRGFDVDDDPFFQAARRMRTDADHFDRPFLIELADDCDNLGGADIQANDQVFVRSLRHSAITPQREHFFHVFVDIRYRRARAVGPADCEAVAVAHVDVFDVRGAARDATATDVEELIEHVRQTVIEKHGVELVHEVRIVGEVAA